MHEVVCEAILPNTFSKTAQLHLEKSLMKLFSKKNSFTSEVELCQTSPKMHQFYRNNINEPIQFIHITNFYINISFLRRHR